MSASTIAPTPESRLSTSLVRNFCWFSTDFISETEWSWPRSIAETGFGGHDFRAPSRKVSPSVASPALAAKASAISSKAARPGATGRRCQCRSSWSRARRPTIDTGHDAARAIARRGAKRDDAGGGVDRGGVGGSGAVGLQVLGVDEVVAVEGRLADRGHSSRHEALQFGLDHRRSRSGFPERRQHARRTGGQILERVGADAERWQANSWSASGSR